MELAHIPLKDLKISPQNMRHGRKVPDISDILPSIRERGIQQPLLVRKTAKGYEIVAGRRRFFSAKAIAETNDNPEPVPCAIMAAGDDTAALEASLLENTARLDPDEMSRFETFARLVKSGKTPANIAVTFGVTELMVNRSLALGNLIPNIRKVYQNEEIDGETIRQLTLASKKQQKEWLRLFEDESLQVPCTWQLKQWLFGGVITIDVALFALEDYKGQIVTDLFGEEGYFQEMDEFWTLQNQCIAAKNEELIKAGWDEVVICDVGDSFNSWAFTETSKKDGGKCYIEIRHSGEVTIHKGYITDKEHQQRMRKASSKGDIETPDTQRPELTKAAQNYIMLHRHAVVRNALLSASDIALRLLVAHAIGGSSLWNIKAEPQKADKLETTESLRKAKAYQDFEKEKLIILKILNLTEHSYTVTRSTFEDYNTNEYFVSLLNCTDEEVMRVLTFVMAETLETGTCLVEFLGCYMAVNMREYWQPDEIFFNLIRDKKTINSMLAQVGGKTVADSNISATAKLQKTIIQDFLSGDGRPKVDDWYPNYMNFPLRAYTKSGTGQPTVNAFNANKLLGKKNKSIQ